MKKCLLLLAASLLAGGVSAQTTENLKITMPESPWNVEAVTEGSDVTGLTFKGQYGFALITAADGTSCTLDPETEANVSYEYEVVLEDASPLALIVECDYLKDGKDDGYAWNNIAKGATSVKFTVDAESCTKGAMSNLYIKASEANDGKDDSGNGCYASPYTVKFKSITRTKTIKRSTDTSGFKYNYILPTENSGQVILKSVLEKFDETDIVVFNFTCADGSKYVGWGVAGLRNPLNKEENAASINITNGDGANTYITFVDELLAICGHHDAETGEGADETEWDGLYYFSWSFDGMTFTKGDIVVYSNKVVEFDNALPTIKSDATVISSEVYSLSGKKVAAPVRGVNIVKQKLSDGSTRTVKFINK